MGGVAGHMAHLSEDTELTFNEIIDILGKVANAEITNATEKVDGQNLFLSWTITPDGEVEVARAGDARTARNAGDIKKGGMTTDEYISKWKGHPAESAFTNGFKAISTALRGLSPEDLEAIFANGQRYVNMEIMYPGNPNIILYSSPNVVLHGLQDFGEEEITPEMRQLTKQKFTKLVSLVDGAVEKVGNENWNIHGPKLVALRKLADGTALEDVTSKIQSFAAPVGTDATLGDYIKQVVKGYAEQVDLPADVTEKLVTLMLNPDEAKEQGITVVDLKKGLPKELQATVSNLGAKTKSRKYIASVLKPLEVAISDFAIEVLRGVKSYFVSDNDQEVARMRAELEQSIAYLKNLQASGDEKMGELVDQQLAKLGDVENLASSMEGVVFEYPPGSDKIYKLTGAFAMANQIIGRARRSGMTEATTEDFTIRISKDREMTKSIDEWLEEIKTAKHAYTKLPQSVYEDILGGTAIVDIVEEENALPTIYNAVMGYVNGLLEEDAEDENVAFELIDDESADPVVDSDFTEQTVAIVPGAFKPPHSGHLKMVEEYLEGGANRVIVLISQPTKTGRAIAGVRDEGISADDSVSIWNMLVAGLEGVEIEKSPHATPISAAYALVAEDPDRTKAAQEADIEPIRRGDTVILGASTKKDTGGTPDWKRWAGATKYVADDLKLMPPAQSAVAPTEHSARYMGLLNISPLKDEMPSIKAGNDSREFHASDMRYLLEKAAEDRGAVELLGDFVGESNISTLLSIFGLGEEMNEMSSGAGGAVAGYSGKRDEEEEPSIIRHENIDLSIVDDVIRLIMEKGIMR